MAADGNSQAVVLVERDSFRRPRPSAAEDRALANKFGLGLLLANDRFAPKAAIDLYATGSGCGSISPVNAG